MKLKLWALLFGMSTGVTFSYGCDVCGCAGMAGMQNLLPSMRASFVGVNYSFQDWKTTMPTSFIYENASTEKIETLTRLDMSLRHRIGEKHAVLGSVTGMYRQKWEYDNYTQYKGLVAAVLGYQYRLLQRAGIKNYQHQVYVTIESEIPIQTTTVDKINYRGDFPGFGHWKPGVQFDYMLKKAQWMLHSQNKTVFTVQNKYGYQPGLSNNMGSRLLYINQRDSSIVMPFVGAAYFTQQTDTYKGKTLLPSGGKAVQISMGLECYFKSFFISASGVLPVWSEFNQGLTRPIYGWNIQISKSINFKNNNQNEKLK